MGRYVDGLIGALAEAGIDLVVAAQRSDAERFTRLAPGLEVIAGPSAISHRPARLAWERLDIIPGVPETLAELGRRHDLLMLTKGEHAEQAGKIERSGLAHLFRRTVITPEKTADTYRDLVAEESLDPARTWMIGNSPRSDILPAVAAGLRGVLVPNPHTLRLEHDDLPDHHDRILHVPDFRSLLEHF